MNYNMDYFQMKTMIFYLYKLIHTVVNEEVLEDFGTFFLMFNFDTGFVKNKSYSINTMTYHLYLPYKNIIVWIIKYILNNKSFI